MNERVKEGPPTLRDLKAKSQNLLDQFVALCNRVTQEGPKIQKAIFSDPMVSERAGATGELGAMLFRLTDEALELDEKRTAALEEERDRYKKALEQICIARVRTGLSPENESWIECMVCGLKTPQTSESLEPNHNSVVCEIIADALTPAPQK